MSLDRRTLLRLGAAGVALGALGGGAWLQNWRARGGRASDRITGPWDQLGVGAQWLLPDLHDAVMVVPDRPHDVEETRDPDRRAAVRRTRTFTVTSSARRLRADTLGGLPAAGTTRLVAIGDSVTFGWGVADTESWPARLGATLATRGRAVELLNAGVPAQRLETMRAWLEQVAPTLGVQGVLFTRRPYPQGPDPIGVYADTIAAVRRALPQARVMVLLPPVSRFDPHGREVGAAEEAALRARLGDVPLLDLTSAMRAAQGDRGASLEIAGAELRVVRGGQTLLTAAAAPHGLPPEIYALFEADPTVREALFFDDGHPDADGFAALAPVIADRIEEAGWFG